MNLSVGYPERAHDAHVLANLAVFQRTQAGNLLPVRKRSICGTDMPLVILGDPAIIGLVNEAICSSWGTYSQTEDL